MNQHACRQQESCRCSCADTQKDHDQQELHEIHHREMQTCTWGKITTGNSLGWGPIGWKHHCREVPGDPGGHQVDLKPLVYVMASKIKSLLGCFRRNGDSRLREMILLLCSALVRCASVVPTAGLSTAREPWA